VCLKILVDLFDMLCTLVAYITYNMGNWNLLDIYIYMPSPSGLRPLGLGICIYQANPSCPCYNYIGTSIIQILIIQTLALFVLLEYLPLFTITVCSIRVFTNL